MFLIHMLSHAHRDWCKLTLRFIQCEAYVGSLTQSLLVFNHIWSWKRHVIWLQYVAIAGNDFYPPTLIVFKLPSVLEVEKAAFCKSVIQQRIADGLADPGAVYDDVATCELDMPVDGFLGGFPCQGVSRAGCGDGLSDARTGMVRHVWRLWDSQVARGFSPSLTWIQMIF